MTQLVWDWNGTLLDDTAAALKAFNVQLVKRSLPPVSLEFYRANFAFPVKPFYALCGVDLAHEDWQRLAAEYHEAYAREPKALNALALAALNRARALGFRQSVLSALRQDLLEAALARFGLREYFDYVVGVDNLDGSSKLTEARALIRKLSGEVVFIGDSLHDAEVARAVGARAILVATGGHSAARLSSVALTYPNLLTAVNAV